LVSLGFETDAFPAVPNGTFGFDPRYDNGSGVSGTLGSPYVAGGIVTPGTWQQVVMVREYNSAFKLYVGGQLVASAVDVGSSLTPPTVQIGEHVGGDSQYFGAFDDFRIYDRALSSNEVAALYVFESTPHIAITAQPSSTTNNVNDTVSFSVSVTNLYPISYQWAKDGVPLPFGTNATLTITNVQPLNIGDYSVTVSDIYGSTATSSNAMLTLNGVDSALWEGLVGYYPFNWNANDVSGNGINGVVNGATLTTDRFGIANSAYNFGNSSSIWFCKDNCVNGFFGVVFVLLISRRFATR
jgi:hypothetical protein